MEEPSEIVIALVSAVGSDLNRFVNFIKEELELYDFKAKEIRISQEVLFSLNPPNENLTKLETINHFMSIGNDYRQVSQHNGALAYSAIAEIAKYRTEILGDDEARPIDKQAWIIRSLKHPEEVKVLRDTYGNNLFLIGIHASEEMRFQTLKNKKKKSDSDEFIKKLIIRDTEEGPSNGHGQHTRDTFHLSDFFINEDPNLDRNKADIERILKLIFDNPYLTPTFDEYAMYMAFSASTRSADLSRQVGAVLAKDCNIISTGANDVPRAGGGLYWPTLDENNIQIADVLDGRDYMRGYDANKNAIQELIDNIVAHLDLHKLEDNQSQTDNNNLKENIENQLIKTKIKDITEYGRVVHAEMEAILSCGRSNNSTIGTTLYCTTFPCHNCAKHIIAAGIMRVVYVEPYSKSKAFEFHHDSIAESGIDGKVTFEPFVGVGPRSFLNVFSMTLGNGRNIRRKDTQGKTIDWSKESAKLRLTSDEFKYIKQETIASVATSKHREMYKNHMGLSKK
ncbi:hypothetical protein VR7878_01835 [Vibrio ruber DSM 16370]|uniref:CMP/dCMP-type deaminase domain-containing protein n=1 Tax=Vibrio ruber (strain DSM 16370 / JCM 11486 / BCRC 17186 / CECT 7878 / LMG 23124 / VR1) TaxID=1123498 RepID=A0A1R4LJ60_VIBR1|nr:anti-phage dCTP deaminase [Vibrio ruber]SJN56555.1 hypothetical protein VR7878_01835 [Vibrio ruber DSM 16370]